MSASFNAIQINKTDDGQKLEFVSLTDDDLMDGDVTVAVSHSTLNYKDSLALTGKAPVIRKWPMIPGIDFAGTVEQSAHKKFKTGDAVVLTGRGVGEGHFGGYAQKARVSGDWLVHLPGKLSPRHAMAIGTAGYTAMLCVLALEDNNVTPGGGDVLVTGATGGVGSVAVALLHKLGYSVAAVTGKADQADYLTGLGAKEIIPRSEFADPAKPMTKSRWAGAIDTAGSNTLANVISQMNYGGTVAACGLAHGMDLKTFVAPFILRAVTLAGVDSVQTPDTLRDRAWKRLEQDISVKILDGMTHPASLGDLPGLAENMLAGKTSGRIVVDLNA